MEQAMVSHGLTIAGRGASGGSSFWMRAPRGVDTEDLAVRLQAYGVLIEPGRAFFNGSDRPRNFYRLAYSSIPTERIEAGIRLIAREIAAVTPAPESTRV
jgi:GntR family transcriptional regulator/MocR family aminotransferase